MFQIKMEKFWKKRKQVPFQILWKQHWGNVYVVSKWPSFVSSSKIFPYSSVALSHTIDWWLCRLPRHHIRVGRFSVQGIWLGLVTQFVKWESMWPTDQNSAINIRCSRYPLPSGPRLALPHPNHWLETHFVLLAKIIEYVVFQQSLSHWFVLIETV